MRPPPREGRLCEGEGRQGHVVIGVCGGAPEIPCDMYVFRAIFPFCVISQNILLFILILYILLASDI